MIHSLHFKSIIEPMLPTLYAEPIHSHPSATLAVIISSAVLTRNDSSWQKAVAMLTVRVAMV